MATRLHSHADSAQRLSGLKHAVSFPSATLKAARPSLILSKSAATWHELPLAEIEDELEVSDDDEALKSDDPQEVVVAGRMRRATQRLSFGSSESLDRLKEDPQAEPSSQSSVSSQPLEEIREERATQRVSFSSSKALEQLIEDPQTESSSQSCVPSQLVKEVREEACASPGLRPSQLTSVVDDVSFSSLTRQRNEQLHEEPWVASAALPSHWVEKVREESCSSCSSLKGIRAKEARDEPSSSINSFSSYRAIQSWDELNFPSDFFPRKEKKRVRSERPISFGSLPSELREVASSNPEQFPESLECAPPSVNLEVTAWHLDFRDQSADRSRDADVDSDFRDRPPVRNSQVVIRGQQANSRPSPRPRVLLSKRVPKPGMRPSGSPRKRPAYVHNASSSEVLKGNSLFPKVVPSVMGAQASSKTQTADKLDYGLVHDALKHQGQIILASLRTQEAQLLKASGHPARESYKAYSKTSWVLHPNECYIRFRSGNISGVP